MKAPRSYVTLGKLYIYFGSLHFNFLTVHGRYLTQVESPEKERYHFEYRVTYEHFAHYTIYLITKSTSSHTATRIPEWL